MKIIKTLALIVALVAINQIFILSLSIPPIIYYLLMSIALLIGLIYAIRIRFNGLMVWLIFASIISIIVNNVPSFFKAPERLITFILMIALLSPLISSISLDILKSRAYKYTNRCLFMFSALSIFLYVFTIPIPTSRGGWAGLYVHSMLMGPLASISMILGFYILYKSRKYKAFRYKRLFIYFATVFSFLCILLASSRSALLGAIAGTIFFFYKIYQFRLSKFFSVILAILLLTIVSFPLWSDFTEGLMKKHDASIEQGNLAETRQSLWNQRLEEFHNSPVFGIGFATIYADKDQYGFNESGGVEPGTSWLAILSMVGIFGFVPVILLFIKYIVFIIRDKRNPLVSATLGGILFLFITHMFAEGYFLASGSYLFFYIWLLLGVIEVFTHYRHLRII